MSITTQIPLQTSLRHLRRAMTILLILSNFAATILADAASGPFTGAAWVGSLLLCLLLLTCLRAVWGTKPISTLRSVRV